MININKATLNSEGFESWLYKLVVINLTLVSIFLFQWFYFEFQQLYSQSQESKDSNFEPVTVKKV